MTVRMRMTVTRKLYPLVAAAPPKNVGLMVRISVRTAPTSTTNMTGLRHIQRGSSLITDCQRAGIRISELKVALRCREVVVRWVSVYEKVWPAHMAKCSAIGPSARTGKKVSAPMISTVPASTPPKRRPSVFIVPTVIGTSFLAAIEPARASIRTIETYRPRVTTVPRLAFHQLVLPFSPANADPLLAAVDV